MHYERAESNDAPVCQADNMTKLRIAHSTAQHGALAAYWSAGCMPSWLGNADRTRSIALVASLSAPAFPSGKNAWTFTNLQQKSELYKCTTKERAMQAEHLQARCSFDKHTLRMTSSQSQKRLTSVFYHVQAVEAHLDFVGTNFDVLDLGCHR